MSLAEWGVIVAMIVALYGAGLSTYNAVANWRQRQPKIRLIANNWTSFTNFENMDGISVVVKIINDGDREVVLDSYRLRICNMPDQDLPAVPAYFGTKRHPDQEFDFPHVLEPGRRVDLPLRLAELAQIAIIHGVPQVAVVDVEVLDQVGRSWRLGLEGRIKVDVEDVGLSIFR